MSRIASMILLLSAVVSAQETAVPRPDAERVDALDAAVQKRFQNIRPEDVRNGRLGMKRSMDVETTHRIALRPENDGERDAIAALKDWTPAFYVAAMGRGGVFRGVISGLVNAGETTLQPPKDFGPVVDLVRRVLKEMAPVQGVAGEIALEARPVVASTAQCLQCHHGRKIGDPLGAVVYAFRKSEVPLAKP